MEASIAFLVGLLFGVLVCKTLVWGVRNELKVFSKDLNKWASMDSNFKEKYEALSKAIQDKERGK